MTVSRPLLRQARDDGARLWLIVVLGFLGGALAVVQAWLLSRLVAETFLGGRPPSAVAGDLALLLGMIVLRAGTVLGGEVAASGVAIHVKTRLRGALVDHLFTLGPAYARGERTGELTATLTEGIESLDAYFSQYLPQLAAAAIIPITILLAVFPLDPLSAIVLCVTAPLIPLFMWLIGKSAEALTKRQYDLLSRLSANFLDILQGLTTLKQLNQSRAQAGVIGQASSQYLAATMSVLRVAFLSALVLEMVATISIAIVAVEVGLRLLYGRMDFQPALFILILAPEFYLPLRVLGQRFHAAAPGVSAARRIFEILAAPAPDFGSPRSEGGPERAAPPAGIRVTFQEVHYSYNGGRPALRGVSFEIPPGKRTALVGPTGAGKSTIINLLLGFIEPTQGLILINGQPMRQWSAAAWRQRIAWVPQTPHLFFDTIAENIRLARPGASLDDVVLAAQKAHLHEFVRSLPQGYDTLIGERGMRLSGGQAQRLALARAFIKDAPFLILDEPTSQVDPELEMLLEDSVGQLMRVSQRTVLVIAHRLSTVYRADQIVVLSAGRVVETGRHDTLAAQQGLYEYLLRPPGSLAAAGEAR